MRRALVLLSLVAILVPLWAAPSWACSCAPIGPAGLAQHADVIFAGTVDVIDDHGQEIEAWFEPALLFKGSLPDRPGVRTEADGASCGYEFLEGRSYTVFAYRDAGALHTHVCSGTTQGDIEARRFGLSEPTVLTTVASPDPRFGSPVFTAAVLMAGVTFAALIALRRRVRT
jgi:hypothetical protein